MKVHKKSVKNALVLVGVVLLIAGIYILVQKASSTVTSAESGDLVELTFTITLDNGTVYATTDTVLAKQHNVSVYVHDAYKFIVGQRDQYFLDDVVVGMKQGEKKTKHVEPKPLPPTKILPRDKSVDRIISAPQKPRFPPSVFKEYFGDVAINDEVRNPEYFPWTYKILNMSEDGWVRLEAQVKAGESYLLPGTPWNSTITDITTATIYLRQDPFVGQIIETYLGKTEVINMTDEKIYFLRTPVKGAVVSSTEGPFIVMNVTEDEIHLRPSRAFLEENAFTVEIELLSLQKGVAKNKKQETPLLNTTTQLED